MKALAEKRNATIFQQICREQHAPKKIIDILCSCCTWPKHNRPTFVEIIQNFHSLADDDFQTSEKQHNHYRPTTTSTNNRRGNHRARDESLYSADEDDYN